jgi:hypothetical protein
MARIYRYGKRREKSITSSDDTESASLIRDANERAQKAREARAANKHFCYYCHSRIGPEMKSGLGRELSYHKNVNTPTILISVCDPCYARKTDTKRCLL